MLAETIYFDHYFSQVNKLFDPYETVIFIQSFDKLKKNSIILLIQKMFIISSIFFEIIVL